MNHVNPINKTIGILIAIPICILVLIVFLTAPLFRKKMRGGL